MLALCVVYILASSVILVSELLRKASPLQGLISPY